MPETTETGFEVPTIPELITRIEADFLANMAGEDPRIPLTFAWATVRVLAGLSYILYRYGAHVAEQVIWDSKGINRSILVRWARMFGIDPLTATKATGTADFEGTEGAEVPEGTLIQRQDGREYISTSTVLVTGGTATVPFVAVLAGDAGNTEAGTLLTLASPIAGIDPEGEVVSDVITGSDDETTARILERLLARVRDTPQGGADADYIAWAREIPGVDQVWVYPHELGAGTVVVRFTVERPEGGDPEDIIPDVGTVALVQAAIDAKAPVTAEVTVLAPDWIGLDLTVDLYPKAPGGVGNTSAQKAAVEAEIGNLLDREAYPPGTGNISYIWNSWVREAISTAEGETRHSLSSVQGGAGTADATATGNEILVLGTVTYIP